MRGVVTNRYRQSTTLGDVNETLGACFFEGGLGAQTSRHKSLHRQIMVVQQGLEFFVALGKRVSHLARGRTDLHRWVDAMQTEHPCKLLIGHEFSLVSTSGSQQVFLLCLHLHQMFLQQVLVQLQTRFDEHAQCQVNDLEFLLGKPTGHLVEQLVCEVHVIDAVVTVTCKVQFAEVGATFTNRVQDFRTFLTQPVTLSQGFE